MDCFQFSMVPQIFWGTQLAWLKVLLLALIIICSSCLGPCEVITTGQGRSFSHPAPWETLIWFNPICSWHFNNTGLNFEGPPMHGVDFSHLFIYLAMLGLQRCVQAGSHCSEQGLLSSCGGFSSCGTRVQQVEAQGLSCPMACGIFPDQGLNLCLLHWQVDS